ncbi:MAG: spondin domain-containing protein [Armatimonas sp.]
MKRITLLVSGMALTSAAVLLSGCGSGTNPATTRTFDVTLTDLTNSAANSGQPFSPPVFVTHDSSVKLWEMNGIASLGVQNIAEGGNRTEQVNALQPMMGTSVMSLETPLTSPLLPGSSVTVRVTVDAAHPYLSHVWMLGRTNDGFGGQAGVNIYSQIGTRTYDIMGMDAGTEVNNEKTGFLGALGGGNARSPENGTIHMHEGITGRGDAPTAWNWANGSLPRKSDPRCSCDHHPGGNRG